MPLVEGTAVYKDAATWEPRILAFCCHWCTYTGADLAGLNRMNYPANVRVLRVPCSGRVNPQYVLTAFSNGCDGVLVCGCHPGDCHYATGNYFAKRRMMAFKRLMEFSGLEPGRFTVRWISGSEAGKFRDTIIEVCEQVRELGPLNAKAEDCIMQGMEQRLAARTQGGASQEAAPASEEVPA
jgi:coenzyme F420-reducing hydrogenase delta subunit